MWGGTQHRGIVYDFTAHPVFTPLVLEGIMFLWWNSDVVITCFSAHCSLNYIIYLNGIKSRAKLVFCQTCLGINLTNTYTGPFELSHLSSPVGHRWSFPLDIILTVAQTWIISFLLIISVWTSERKKILDTQVQLVELVRKIPHVLQCSMFVIIKQSYTMTKDNATRKEIRATRTWGGGHKWLGSLWGTRWGKTALIIGCPGHLSRESLIKVEVLKVLIQSV